MWKSSQSSLSTLQLCLLNQQATVATEIWPKQATNQLHRSQVPLRITSSTSKGRSLHSNRSWTLIKSTYRKKEINTQGARPIWCRGWERWIQISILRQDRIHSLRSAREIQILWVKVPSQTKDRQVYHNFRWWALLKMKPWTWCKVLMTSSHGTTVFRSKGNSQLICHINRYRNLLFHLLTTLLKKYSETAKKWKEFRKKQMRRITMQGRLIKW